METLIVWLVIGGVLGGITLLGAILNALAKWQDKQRLLRSKALLYDERVAELSRLEEYRNQLNDYRSKVERWETAVRTIVDEKTQGFPWLAQAFADYFHLEDLKQADYLRVKRHRAPVAAAKVKEIAGQKRRAEAELRVAKYLLRYYENLFPWLVDFQGEDVDEMIQSKLQPQRDDDLSRQDPARMWLAEGEYRDLPTVEKFQMALDRYWNRPRSRWEIGRDYERYTGYLYEKAGWQVYYQGIAEGFDDLGRDLVAKYGDNVEIVQCKYWSQDKVIHEKHIFQLFGTVVAYQVDNKGANVRGRFVTSTNLSHRAREIAEKLNIEVADIQPMKPYPCIKCNVSRRDGAKIYHLPFDQQYDNTLVEVERGECYASTVAEAEALGFRRAFRWKGAQTTAAPNA